MSNENENKNPFESLAEIYDDSVKEHDKAGFADKFKACTEQFLKGINEEINFVDDPVHFEDIEYLDGYFIFGTGTNSVIHFHIKECPGWLFGIWWSAPDEDKPEQKYITGEFFAQFEEAIDKFKPSNSEICITITAVPDSDTDSFWSAAKLINFIKNEPYLAFCRDYCFWDYNEEFHTREEAKAKYDAFREYKDNKEKYTKLLDEKILSFVNEKIVPCFNNAEVIDRGDSWSPRYYLYAPIEDNDDLFPETGLYDWFEQDDEDGQRLLEEFNKLIKECEEISDEHDILYYTPIWDSINVIHKHIVDKSSEGEIA